MAVDTESIDLRGDNMTKSKFTLWIHGEKDRADIGALKAQLRERTASKAIWTAIRGYAAALTELEGLRGELAVLKAAAARYREESWLADRHADLRDEALARLTGSPAPMPRPDLEAWQAELEERQADLEDREAAALP